MTNEKPMIGAALAKLLREEQEERGLNLSEMADMLSMSKPYLTALLSGDRQINKLSDSYLEAIALFLKLPKGQVYNLAEILLPEDYIHKDTIESELTEIRARLSKDPSWMHLGPSEEEWQTLPIKFRLLIGYMYENLSHAKIIDGITSYRFEGE